VHFEIHAEDPSRARTFYQQLFDWEFTQWGGQEYWLIKTGTGPGIDGGMIRRRGPAPAAGQPVNAYVCTIEVGDLDEVVSKANGMGASTVVPRMAIPGVGWLAYSPIRRATSSG
jgi:hypothetical protein